jgi:hypothetical protein
VAIDVKYFRRGGFQTRPVTIGDKSKDIAVVQAGRVMDRAPTNETKTGLFRVLNTTEVFENLGGLVLIQKWYNGRKSYTGRLSNEQPKYSHLLQFSSNIRSGFFISQNRPSSAPAGHLLPDGEGEKTGQI